MLESEAGTSKAASAGPSDQMAEQKSDPQAWPRFTFADDTDLPRLKMSHTMNEEITNVEKQGQNSPRLAAANAPRSCGSENSNASAWKRRRQRHGACSTA